MRAQTRAEQHRKELAEAEVLFQETRAALEMSQKQATLLSQRAEGDAAEVLQEQGKRKRAEAEAEVLRAKARTSAWKANERGFLVATVLGTGAWR